MIKTNLLFKLKVKDCDRIFAAGFESGILVVQSSTYKLPEDYNRSLFLHRLRQDERDFLDECVEVIIEENKDEMYNTKPLPVGWRKVPDKLPNWHQEEYKQDIIVVYKDNTAIVTNWADEVVEKRIKDIYMWQSVPKKKI